MTLTATTSHTVGPYYHIGLTWLNRENLTVEQTLGERVAITGQVLDGNGDVVNDAMLEVWQANAAGKYDHPEDDQDKPLDPNFEGFRPDTGGCRRSVPFHHYQTGQPWKG